MEKTSKQRVKNEDLKRFKGTQTGLIEFATILEQASPKQCAKIISETRKIDPLFLKKALKKAVFFEELIYLDESILAEILSATSNKILACSLKKMDSLFVAKIHQHLGYRELKGLLDEADLLKRELSDSLILGSRRQILKMARQLEKKCKITFELLDCPRFKLNKRGIE